MYKRHRIDTPGVVLCTLKCLYVAPVCEPLLAAQSAASALEKWHLICVCLLEGAHYELRVKVGTSVTVTSWLASASIQTTRRCRLPGVHRFHFPDGSIGYCGAVSVFQSVSALHFVIVAASSSSSFSSFHVCLSGLILCSTCDRKHSITLRHWRRWAKFQVRQLDSVATFYCLYIYICIYALFVMPYVSYTVDIYSRTEVLDFRSPTLWIPIVEENLIGVIFCSQPDSCSTYAFDTERGEQSFRCVSGTGNNRINITVYNIYSSYIAMSVYNYCLYIRRISLANRSLDIGMVFLHLAF